MRKTILLIPFLILSLGCTGRSQTVAGDGGDTTSDVAVVVKDKNIAVADSTVVPSDRHAGLHQQKDSQGVEGWDLKDKGIAGHQFDVATEYFRDGKSFAFHYSTRLTTYGETQQLISDLRQYFEKDYGAPKAVNPLPADNNIRRTMTYCPLEWVSGENRVTVYMTKNYEGITSPTDRQIRYLMSVFTEKIINQ